MFCERTVVFLGYSLNDPNIQFIYHEVLFDQKTLGEFAENESFSQFRPSFFVTEHPATEQDKAYYRHKRIRYVDGYSIEHFFREIVDAYDRDRTRRENVTEAVRNGVAQYLPLFEQLNWNTDPAEIPIPDGEELDYIAKLLVLIELYEVVYRRANPSQPGIPELDPVRMMGVAQGALRVLDYRCHEFLRQGRTDVLESILEFLETRLRQHRKGMFILLLDKVGEWLAEFQAIQGINHFVRRYCVLLFQYDRDYNDWSDYTFCLDRFVRSTRLFPFMPPSLKGAVAKGLYNQLEMCGRGLGDSWYTTNKVYEVWGSFDPRAWPPLEAEIRRHLPGLKQNAMLNHLSPGADYRQFLPRE